METIPIPRFIVNQLFIEAQSNTKEEVCGLVSRKNGRPFRVYPIKNIAKEKNRLFEMEPAQQIAAMKCMRDNQEELFAIYHSHPRGPAEPSAIDIEQASYPDALYLIISLNDKTRTDMRGFYLQGGQAESVNLEI